MNNQFILLLATLKKNLTFLLVLIVSLNINYKSNAQCSGTTLNGSITSAYPSANSDQNKTFWIDQDLDIDKNFTFTNCTLRVADGISISVDGDASTTTEVTLTLVDCYIHSCDGNNMWRGLILTDSYSSINMDGCWIEDAEDGIYTEELSEIIVDDCDFNRNNIHININTPQNFSSLVPAGWAPNIEDSRFFTKSNYGSDCTACLIDPYEELDPEIGIHASTYLANNTLLTILRSQIKNAGIGIHEERNELYLEDVKIEDGNTGIFVERDCELEFVTSGPTAASIIDNFSTGLEMIDDNSRIFIQNVDFSDGRRGVWSHRGGIYIHGDILNCTFTDYSSVGIAAFGNHADCTGSTQTCRLHLNENEFENIGNIAIFVAEPVKLSGIDYQINENKFTDVGSGIFVVNIDNPEIIDNAGPSSRGMDIGDGIVNSWGGYVGILAAHCNDAVVQDNFISSDVANMCDLSYIGINATNCLSMRLQCNKTENVGSGLKYEGIILHQPIISRTRFGEAEYPFHLFCTPQGLGTIGIAPTGISNPGTFFDNEWDRDRCLDGDHTYSEFSNFSPGFTEFVVRDDGLPYDPIWHGDDSGPSSTCTDDPHETEQNVAVCPDDLLDYDPDIKWPIVIANKEDEWPYYEDEFNWQSDYMYYQWAMRSDSIVDNDTLTELAEYVDYLIDSTSFSEIFSIQDSIAKLSHDHQDTNLTSKISAIMDEILDITPQNEIEENFVEFYYLFLERYHQDVSDYDSTAIDTLTSIAEQCHLTGGHPVILARLLLLDLNDSTLIFIDSCEFTDEDSRFGKNDEEEIYNNSRLVSLYPNPSQGEITLKINAAISDGTRIDIVNSLGQIVFTSHLKMRTSIFDLSDNPAGVYFMKIFSKDGSKIFKSFVLTAE